MRGKRFGLLDNLQTITASIRKAGMRIFIVPDHRWEPGDYKAGSIRRPHHV
jgi:hypothetical protein